MTSKGYSVKARLDITRGVISINGRDIWGSGGARHLRARESEIERQPFTFTERHGLRRYKKLSYEQINILRLAMPACETSIDFLKNRISGFAFTIVRADGKRHNNYSEKRAEKAKNLLMTPNQFGHTWRMRLRMFVDNLLERDLGTIEKEKYPAGGIRQWGIIDSSKMRPNPNNFQGDLDKDAYFELDAMLQEQIVNRYKKDEIVWANFNPRPGSFYGFSPIEVLDTIILMSIYSNKHNLKIVSPSNERGGGIVYLGNKLSPASREEFERRYDLFRQNDPNRPLFTAGGDAQPSYLSLKDKTDMDWVALNNSLMEITASCFQLNLRDIGIQQQKGNAGTAAIDDLITMRSAIIPRCQMLEDIFTLGLVQPAAGDDLAFRFMVRREEAYETRVRAGNMAVGRGGMTLNEYREGIDENLAKYPPEIGDEPIIIAGNNVFKLKDIMMGKANPLNNPAPENPDDKSGDKFKRTTDRQTDRGTDQNWS